MTVVMRGNEPSFIGMGAQVIGNEAVQRIALSHRRLSSGERSGPSGKAGAPPAIRR
jgi:hypothetical protein